MKRSGTADLPLHGGHVPRWLSERMTKLGGAIIESIVMEYGRSEVISRLSDPAWFQSLGSAKAYAIAIVQLNILRNKNCKNGCNLFHQISKQKCPFPIIIRSTSNI